MVNDNFIVLAVISAIAGIFFGLWTERFKIFSAFGKKNDGFPQILQQKTSSSGTSNYLAQDTNDDDKNNGPNDDNDIHNDSENSVFRKSPKELREELKVLQFEKKITSKSMQDIFYARKDGKIDAFEYDRLVSKYKRDLVFYNQQIDKIAAELDFSELFVLRNEIDGKISDLKIKYKLQDNSLDTNTESQFTNSDKIDAKEDKQIADNKNDINKTKKEIDLHLQDKEQIMIEKFKDDVTRAIERLDNVKTNTKEETDVLETLKNPTEMPGPVKLESQTTSSHETAKQDDLSRQYDDIDKRTDKKESIYKIESNFASPLSFIYKQNHEQERNLDGLLEDVKPIEDSKENDISNNIKSIEKEHSKIVDNSPLNRIVKH